MEEEEEEEPDADGYLGSFKEDLLLKFPHMTTSGVLIYIEHSVGEQSVLRCSTEEQTNTWNKTVLSSEAFYKR